MMKIASRNTYHLSIFVTGFAKTDQNVTTVIHVATLKAYPDTMTI